MTVRRFRTGATRSPSEGKYEYARFFDPRVLQARAAFMHKHRLQTDGQLRDPDNWKRGIPLKEWMGGIARHFHDLWMLHEGYEVVRPEDNSRPDVVESLCALMFGAEGYLKEYLDGARNVPVWRDGQPAPGAPSLPSDVVQADHADNTTVRQGE